MNHLQKRLDVLEAAALASLPPLTRAYKLIEQGVPVAAWDTDALEALTSEDTPTNRLYHMMTDAELSTLLATPPGAFPDALHRYAAQYGVLL